jgi:hypothetical protein
MAVVGPLIVGSVQDEHVQAVLQALEKRGVSATLIDATGIDDADGAPWATGRVPSIGHRGWIRRLAPAQWHRGLNLDSHDAVARGAWLSLLAGRLLTDRCSWLTSFPDLLAAENKLLQLSTAESLGLHVPQTVVATHIRDVGDFGSTVVVKPLGPAAYIDDDGVDRVVSAQRIATADLTDELLGAAPFLFQREVAGTAHMRVVTVGQQVWSARLRIDESLPLDWRLEDAAHDSFRTSHEPTLELAAVRLAGALRAGYSSQDWIDTEEGFTFLDLNPAGQWLFLPDAVADPVTNALADFLSGR